MQASLFRKHTRAFETFVSRTSAIPYPIHAAERWLAVGFNSWISRDSAGWGETGKGEVSNDESDKLIVNKKEGIWAISHITLNWLIVLINNSLAYWY